MRGKFISLEGQDGAGKSTHIPFIKALIEKTYGVQVIVTREPGGTPIGEKLRELLLHDVMTPDTEALLMAASRCEHISQVIEPALKAGIWVLCDRYVDSSYAYQVGGRGIDLDRMDDLAKWSTDGLLPDKTFLFVVDPIIAHSRMGDRTLDNFEAQNMEFFTRVGNAYTAQMTRDPRRFHIISTKYTIESVEQQLSAVLPFLFPTIRVSLPVTGTYIIQNLTVIEDLRVGDAVAIRDGKVYKVPVVQENKELGHP